MESRSRLPVLKGRPFFEQLRLSISFIDSNMKLIDNSVKTSNTDEEYNYVKSVLGKAAKYNDDVNAMARCVKMNNVLKRSANEFEDEVQNLKEMLRCKEIDYRLEPFKYPTTDLTNGQSSVQTNGNGHKQQQVQSAASNQFGQLAAPESRLKFLNRNGQFGKGVLKHVLNSASKYSNQNSAHKNPHHHTDTINPNGQSLKSRLDPTAGTKVSYTQTINLNSLSSNFNPNQLSNKNKCSSIKKKDTFLLKDGPVDGAQIKRPESKVTFAQKDGQQQPKESQADLTSESIDPSNQFSFDFKLPYNKLKNNYYPSSSNFSVDESLEIEFTPGLKSRRVCKKPQTLNESNASTQDLQSFDKQGLQFDNRDNSIRSDLSLCRPDGPAKHEPLADRLEQTYIKPDGNAKPEDLQRPVARSDAGDKENQQEFVKQDFTKQEFTKPEPVKSELSSGSPARTADKFDTRFDLKVKSQKLATPKKPPNFDFLNF